MSAAAQKNDKLMKMTTEPVEKLILGLALPSITIMVISALYNMADTYFVSSLGTSAVAGVGIAFPLMNVISAMGFSFGQGSGNYMARALGAKKTEAAARMAATGFVSGFIVMAFLAGVLIFFIGPLVDALGSTETIWPYAREYIFYILIASPWMVAATILNQQLRFQGSAAMALIGMVSGTVLNCFLCPLFIFVFHMGVKGAAIATMLSQMTSFLILFFYSATRPGNIAINLKLFSPSVARYAEMIQGGVPAFIRQSLLSVANIIINHFAGFYGDAAIAAISIVNRIITFANSVIIGFGQGFQPVCGFNYGARLYSRVRRAFWFCVRIACGGLLFVVIILAWFAPMIITQFRRDDPDVIRIGAMALRLDCISLPFTGFVSMANMITQTMGMAMEASLVATARQGLMLIPALFILRPIFGLLGIQLATPVSDMASLFIVIPIMIRVLKIISVPDGMPSMGTKKAAVHEMAETE
ncbi:MAG: MATE family efflux transporter [Treponema sp.]|nr:MATE family efflux transporter [Treponema sp.]